MGSDRWGEHPHDARWTREGIRAAGCSPCVIDVHPGDTVRVHSVGDDSVFTQALLGNLVVSNVAEDHSIEVIARDGSRYKFRPGLDLFLV